jgi:hypothetical protein
MVERTMLKISFTVRCNNMDVDMIHVFEFDNEDDLLDFLRENEECIYCNSELLTQDIRVFYKMNSDVSIGEING